VLFVRAFFLAKANNLAAIEFGKSFKRFGLRMVEGDIFQSERRSSK
jgi:hypothetical protein